MLTVRHIPGDFALRTQADDSGCPEVASHLSCQQLEATQVLLEALKIDKAQALFMAADLQWRRL